MRKLKLLLTGFALLGGVFSANAQTSWTGDITNADGLEFTKQYVAMSDGDVAETWKTSINEGDGFDLNQSLTSVPDGVYELSAQAMYRASLTYGTPTNCVLYATVGETTFSTPIANFGDYTSKEDRTATGGIGTQMKNNNAYLNIVPAVIVEGGNVTIGMKSIGELTYCTNGYWFVLKKSTFTFKNVTETYHAKLVARATTMLATAPASAEKTTLSDALTTYADANFANVKALQAAINTFLETATVENPLNVTDFINNPSFEDNSGNKKNWIQDLGYKQPSDIYQPTGWNMLYSSAKVNNVQYQTYKTQTDNAKDGYCYYVRQRWNDVYAKVDLHQLVKELPAGAYRLTVAVKGGSNVTDPNKLSMKAGSNSNTTTVSDFDKTNYKDYSVQVNKESADADLDICYAWDQQRTDKEQLYYIDDFRLYYLGDPVKAKKAELLGLQGTIDASYLNNSTYDNVIGTERTNLTTQKTATAASETVEAYETVISNVQAAIDAFTAAKTNYDALVAEIEKAKNLGIATATADSYAATSSSTAADALTSTQALKVAEYNYVKDTYQYSVDLGKWTTTGPTGSKNDQHWSSSTHDYLEQSGAAWGTSAWEISYDQDLTLPAGNYVFKVAGRKAASDGVTLGLTVTNKATSDVLGSVNDFPEGDTGLGINKSGVTSFDPEDAAGFANGGAGRGWEWRFVKFNLASDGTVNVAVNAVATTSHMWVSFCDATVQTDDDANISLIEYNIALNDANNAIGDSQYDIVTGPERTELQDAIDADEDLDKTDKEAIDAAKTLLDTKREAFIAAKAGYEAWATASTFFDDDDYTQVLYPYASDAKFAAIATAKAMTIANGSERAEKAAAYYAAYRGFVESNAMAEKIAGAINKTSLIENANAQQGDENAVTPGQAFGFTKGTGIERKNAQPLVNAAGEGEGNYFDYWSGSAWNKEFAQTIKDLPAGKYIMTVSSRGSSSLIKFDLKADGETAAMKHIDGDQNTGTFGYGWNDNSVLFTHNTSSDMTFSIDAEGNNHWMSFDRFRLVKIAEIVNEADNYTPEATTLDVTLLRTFNVGKWNTFVVPFDIENTELKANFGNDVEVAVYSEVADGGNSTVSFTKMATPSITANTPVLLKTSTDETSFEFTNKEIKTGDAKVAGTNFDFVGTYAASSTIDADDYFISSNKLYKSAGTTTIAGTRAYLKANSAEARIAGFSIGEDEPTGISTIATQKVDNAAYDMQGRRVETMKKGVYVVNGKKVVIK